jgi:hypothetical protein
LIVYGCYLFEKKVIQKIRLIRFFWAVKGCRILSTESIWIRDLVVNVEFLSLLLDVSEKPFIEIFLIRIRMAVQPIGPIEQSSCSLYLTSRFVFLGYVPQMLGDVVRELDEQYFIEIVDVYLTDVTTSPIYVRCYFSTKDIDLNNTLKIGDNWYDISRQRARDNEKDRRLLGFLGLNKIDGVLSIGVGM